MLQQTQAQNVVPYFLRFVARFPTVRKLASASPAAVARAWSGLGYYARVQNLQKAAKLICERSGGEPPRTLDEWMALPGVGRSTAGAILALCYGERVAILDGTGKRLLARHRLIKGYPGRAAVSARLWDWSERLLPESKRSMPNYTQAIMDLGATVCTRVNAACDSCPVAGDCLARRHRCVDALPEPRPRKTLPVKRVCMVLATCGGKVLMKRRPTTGLWAGLLSLPEAEDAPAARAWLRRTLGVRLQRTVGATGAKDAGRKPRTQDGMRHNTQNGMQNGTQDESGKNEWPAVRHSFSHFHLDIAPLLVELERAPRVARQAGDLIWCKIETGKQQAPAPVKRLLAKLLQLRNENK